MSDIAWVCVCVLLMWSWFMWAVVSIKNKEADVTISRVIAGSLPEGYDASDYVQKLAAFPSNKKDDKE